MKILSQVRCSCDGRGNPLPSLVWEIAGEPLNGSSDVPIKEVLLGRASVRSLITLHGLDKEPPPLVCHSVNPLGADSFVFNVSASQTQLGDDISQEAVSEFCSASARSLFLTVVVSISGLHSASLLIGSGVGALATLLVCVPLLLFFCR